MPFIRARVLSVIRLDTPANLANAGPNQSVLCDGIVFLEGEIIPGPVEDHTFEWEQTFGTPIIAQDIFNIDTLTPSFINPQVSDIEFTLYVDRNTPFEDSDAVFISRGPEDRPLVFIGSDATTSPGGTVPAEFASTTTTFLTLADATVTGSAFTDPPARYSPIYTTEDLDRVRNNLSGSYMLMNDLDFVTDLSINSTLRNNWDPIGTAESPFSGLFDGNGYVINNLSITNSVRNSGLFGTMDGVTIENLGVTNANVTGQTSTFYSGILAGVLLADNASTINNCWTEGVVASEGDRAGGFVGYTATNVGTIFTNTYADVTVTGGGIRTGGWAGFFETESQYVENYGNTTKTALIVGSGGDTPIAGEVEGRTTSELRTQVNYTDWDFVDRWEIGVVSPLADDPFFNSVAFQADWDGTNLDTEYTEQSLNLADGTFINEAELTTVAAETGSTGLALDGTLDSVQFPFGTHIALQEFTIEASIFVASASTGLWNNIVAHFEETGNNRGWYFAFDNDSLRLGWSDEGISTWLASVVYNIPADTYVKVAVERTGTDQLSFYVNGTQQGTTQTMTNPDIRLPTGGQSLWVGDLDAATATDFEGRIDNVRITIGTARYRGDYTPTEFGEGTSLATLQDKSFNRIRRGGFCDDQWMITWDAPNEPRGGIVPLQYSPTPYTFKGVIIEERVGTRWGFLRFIPKQQHTAPLTPDIPHRLTTVWRHAARGQQPKEINVINDGTFISKNSSIRFGPYGNTAVAIAHGGAALSADFTIQIVNPRKISKNTTDDMNFPAGATATVTVITNPVFRAVGTAKPEEDTLIWGFGSANAVTDSVVITRSSGISIG